MGELLDGYGDDRTAVDYQQYILDNERLLKLQAAERLRHNPASRNIYDDVLNEGRLIQFLVLTKRPDASRPYVHASMSKRITECIRSDSWTGSEAKRGHPVDPLRRPLERDSVNDETLFLDEIVDSSNWVDEVIMAYHHGEIAQVLSELSNRHRQYIVARFWYGLTNPEIAAIQGCSRETVERQWRTEIKPYLSQQLEHLATLP